MVSIYNKEQQVVFVFTEGEAGVGKSSLIREQNCEKFKEFGFDTVLTLTEDLQDIRKYKFKGQCIFDGLQSDPLKWKIHYNKALIKQWRSQVQRGLSKCSNTLVFVERSMLMLEHVYMKDASEQDQLDFKLYTTKTIQKLTKDIQNVSIYHLFCSSSTEYSYQKLRSVCQDFPYYSLDYHTMIANRCLDMKKLLMENFQEMHCIRSKGQTIDISITPTSIQNAQVGVYDYCLIQSRYTISSSVKDSRFFACTSDTDMGQLFLERVLRTRYNIGIPIYCQCKDPEEVIINKQDASLQIKVEAIKAR